MAAAKKETEAIVEQKKTVTKMLPKAGKNEPNFVFVSVNGKNYKIMRGVPVEMPREVAEVLQNADDARDEADSFIEAVTGKE
jgi:hypothetical protein